MVKTESGGECPDRVTQIGRPCGESNLRRTPRAALSVWVETREPLDFAAEADQVKAPTGRAAPGRFVVFE